MVISYSLFFLLRLSTSCNKFRLLLSNCLMFPFNLSIYWLNKAILFSYSAIFLFASLKSFNLLLYSSVYWVKVLSLISKLEFSSTFIFKLLLTLSNSWLNIIIRFSYSLTFLLTSPKSVSLLLNSSLSWVILVYLVCHSWMVTSYSPPLLLLPSTSWLRVLFSSTLFLRFMFNLSISWLSKAILFSYSAIFLLASLKSFNLLLYSSFSWLSLFHLLCHSWFILISF